MRKSLEAISLGALALLAWITWDALYGPGRLYGPIPTHFDRFGHIDGWSSRQMLALMPALALILYLGMTLVTRSPSAFHYPVRVTPENRLRLEALALEMSAWLKAELVCLFAWIQWSIVAAARSGHGNLPPALVLVSVLVIWATIASYIVAMRRTGRSQSRP